MQLHAWVASDVGQTRKVNEDSYLIAPDLGLAAVALMALALRASPPLGFVGVSVLGAQAHVLQTGFVDPALGAPVLRGAALTAQLKF